MKCSQCGGVFPEGTPCPYCGHTEPQEETPIPTVSAEREKRKKSKRMDKILIIVVIAVLVIAVVTAVVIIRHKKAKPDEVPGAVSESAGDTLPEEEPEETDFDPVTFSEDVSVTFEGITTAFAGDLEDFAAQSAGTTAVKPETTAFSGASGTTAASGSVGKPQKSPEQYLEETTVYTTNPTAGNNDALRVIAAFFSGTYYLDGTMISGGEEMPLEIAMNGADYEVFTEMDGSDIAIMNLGGKIYLLNPANKKYMELSSAVQKMMGISDDMFTFEFTKIKFDAYSPTAVTQATYKGSPAVCYSYRGNGNALDFITVNNEIRQLILYNADGKADTVLETDEFSAQIPGDMLNFKGYSKTNMISFMSSMM